MKKNSCITFSAVAACVLFAAACGAQTRKNYSGFKKHVLSTKFKSEGAAVADVNKDGRPDVIAGPEWFEAPSWKVHQIYQSRAYDPAKEYSSSFLNYVLDVNFDGWEDVIVIGFPGEPGFWYENPQNKEGLWSKHAFLPEVGIGNESPAFVDVDRDGRPDILCTDSRSNQLVWLQAPVNKSDPAWRRFPISAVDAAAHKKFTHGIGIGDLNNDGRNDVFTKIGWWEAPDDPKKPSWAFHPVKISEDCSQMHAFDVNGDGLTDIISASAHKRGIWWHQQLRGADGTIGFETRQISDLFTQSHASAFADIDLDGNPDLISGKRFFAHNDTDHDPGAHDPAVLYWFKYLPGTNPRFTPYLVDNDSGAGLHIVVADVDLDKREDIVIANKKGVFYFENRIKNK